MKTMKEENYTRVDHPDGSIVFTPRVEKPIQREPEKGDVWRTSKGSYLLFLDDDSYCWLSEYSAYVQTHRLGDLRRLQNDCCGYFNNVQEKPTYVGKIHELISKLDPVK